MANGTTHHDWYTASRVSSQLWDGGRALVQMRGGSEEEGPVEVVQYTHAEKIIRRPAKGEKKK